MESRSRTPSPERPKTTDLSGNRPNNGWTKEQEELMAGWADIAAGYRWMHDKGEKKTATSNMWITVPVIILSTLTGSANFMLQTIVTEPESQKFAQIGIGAVSIFTGILTTLGNFFRYAQSSESNRVASISWGKFQRQIAIELALHPLERIDSLDFLKICRTELDRLIEQSPPIPDDIIFAFEKEFQDLKDFKRPDIAHGVDHTKTFNNNTERVKQLAVEAAIMLKQKRRVWHEAMMPEVDKRVSKAIVDISGSMIASMHDRVKVLEEIVNAQADRAVSHPRSFTRNPSIERGRKNTLGSQLIDQTLPNTTTDSDDLIIALTQPRTRKPISDEAVIEVKKL